MGTLDCHVKFLVSCMMPEKCGPVQLCHGNISLDCTQPPCQQGFCVEPCLGYVEGYATNHYKMPNSLRANMQPVTTQAAVQGVM